MKIIGHRGARALSPENTIASVKKAIRHGVQIVEVDVRMTRDGVAILHHDPHISVPDGHEIIIAKSLYADLLKHKSDLATLDHAIQTVKHRCDFLIEIKPHEPIEPVVATIKDHVERGWQLNEFAVTSFDFDILSRVQKQLPGIELVVLEKWSGVRADYHARRLDTKRISMNQRWLWQGFLRHMKRKGYLITPYTMNNPKQVKVWQPYLYGIITDRPDLFEDAHQN